MQSPLYLIAVFLIIALIVPISFTIKINYNALKNFGIFGLKIWFLKFRISSFKITKNAIEITSRATKKVSEVELTLTKEQVLFLRNLTQQFKDKIKVKEISFHSVVGVNNAFESAILSGIINQTACGALAYVKNFKQTGTMKVSSETKFNSMVLKVSLKIKVSISIYDLIYSLIMSVLKLRRRERYEQKIRRRKFNKRFA